LACEFYIIIEVTSVITEMFFSCILVKVLVLILVGDRALTFPLCHIVF